MEIPQGSTLENRGKQNPKMGFKSPPEQRVKYRSDYKKLQIRTKTESTRALRTKSTAGMKTCIPAAHALGAINK